MDQVLRELSREEYETSFSPPMQDVTHTAEEIVDLWPYAERALKETFSGACTCDLTVGYVYESGDGLFQHILVPSHISNVYLVVVVSKVRRAIVGHHRLDLGTLYGLHDA
jgi:hypothetical protein